MFNILIINQLQFGIPKLVIDHFGVKSNSSIEIIKFNKIPLNFKHS